MKDVFRTPGGALAGSWGPVEVMMYVPVTSSWPARVEASSAIASIARPLKQQSTMITLVGVGVFTIA